LLLVAPTLAENWVHALVATGRWDEAEDLAQELEQQWAAEGMSLALHLELARVAAARGDAASFERTMSTIERFARADDPYALHDVTAARAEHLLWRGDAQEAHRIARESLTHLADQQDFGLVVSMCTVALRAQADRVTTRADRVMSESAARETAQLLTIAQHAAERDTGALGHAHLLLCEAEAARASLRPSADPWTTVVTTWQHLDCPYPTAYAQWRQAEELFGARARAQGTRALASALQTAAQLRCAPLESSLRMLARHAGVSPVDLETTATETDAGAPDSLPVPLTPRERDVLQILTQGFSNQQIARRLFISESTVSVHVSHVIAKLGVANRLQAAAAAHRLNLFPSEDEGV
jgi:ATP/maltotriose-dependent transcriptional regulator MalT